MSAVIAVRGQYTTRFNHIQQAGLGLAILLGWMGGAAALDLSMPVACSIGTDCAIQQYVDHDSGPGAVDYLCGAQTYEGHNGTDFRLPHLRAMEAGVAVLAAADGVVARVRDGVEDRVYQPGTTDVQDRECGNGVLVEHGHGWASQYCHMKQGSVSVSPGDPVQAGTPLGKIGLSGQTEFPHLHFTLRQADRIVDPFRPEPAAGPGKVCDKTAEPGSLWRTDAGEALRYRDPHVLNVGFADAPVTMEQVESGVLQDRPLDARAPAMVVFGRAIGIRAGDRQHLTIAAPDGSILVDDLTDPADRAKAQLFAFAGKRRPVEGWPAGNYVGRYSIVRDGLEVASGEARFEIK